MDKNRALIDLIDLYTQTLAAIKAWDDVIEFGVTARDVLHEDIKKYEARLEMARENYS